MPIELLVNDLIDYSDWERGKWLDWMRQQDPSVLAIGAGPGGDGRFEKVGDLIRHVFSAEKRYVDRLSGRPITDTSTMPADDLEALFAFGARGRDDLKEFLESMPAESWDLPHHLKLMNFSLTATPRKIVAHVLMHEIRHWAQIATLLRLNGLKPDLHDFLFSPVMGGEFKIES